MGGKGGGKVEGKGRETGGSGGGKGGDLFHVLGITDFHCQLNIVA